MSQARLDSPSACNINNGCYFTAAAMHVTLLEKKKHTKKQAVTSKLQDASLQQSCENYYE